MALGRLALSCLRQDWLTRSPALLLRGTPLALLIFQGQQPLFQCGNLSLSSSFSNDEITDVVGL